MPVNATRQEYDKIKEKWKLVRAIVDNDAKDFLVDVDINDQIRNNNYKKNAVLTNFTKLTKNGLLGLVFKKESIFTFPEELAYLEEDATGCNLGFEQFAQYCLGEVLETGRLGLLAELPLVTEGYTDGDEPTVSRIKSYCAETIINWRHRQVGNRQKACLIVLKESVDQLRDPEGDPFDWVTKVQYRVLYLDFMNQYKQILYNGDDFNIIPGTDVKPLDYNGNPFDEIPFIFLGSENNDPDIDPIPLYDLARLNLAHYQNSADYEESIFITGQPSLFISTEMSEDEFKVLHPNGIKFGSRAGSNLGPGGMPYLLQANPNQLVATAMTEKLANAAAIGARLISPAGGRETAEAAKIRYGAQNSALYNITHNVANGLELCLWFNARYMMEKPVESEVELNDQYYDDAADPNLIAQEIVLLQNKAISIADIRNYLRAVGVIAEDRTDEDIDADIQKDPPLMADLQPTTSSGKDQSTGVE